MSEELPEGWVFAKLDELLEPNGLFDGPFGSSLKTSDYTSAGARVIRLENLANLRFVAEKETYISEAKYKTLTKHTVVADDIMVGSFVDGAVRVCLLPQLPTPAIAKADCFTVRTRQELADRRFIMFQLGASSTADAFIGDIHGATRPRITTKQLRDCPLMLAPLPEQHRIVAAVEGLLEKVARAKARLDRVAAILKRFRQAVLAAACSGELTREWRENHPFRPLAPAARDEVEGQYEVPEEWVVASLGSLAEVIDPQPSHRTPPQVPGGIPYVGMGDVRGDGSIDLANARKVAHGVLEEHRARYSLASGDFIFGKIGTLGEPTMLPEPFDYALSANVVLVQPRRHCVPRYLTLFMEGPALGVLLQETANASAQAAFGIKRMRNLAVPTPSVEEQAEIVHQVDRLFALANTIEARVKAATARADRLPQAILSKAFSGELVPTEAELARAEGRTYETAEELLRRVTAKTPATKTRAKRKGSLA